MLTKQPSSKALTPMLQRRASSLLQGAQQGLALAREQLGVGRSSGGKALPDGPKLTSQECRVLMDNMKGLLVHLRVRQKLLKKQGDESTLFPPSEMSGTPKAVHVMHAKAIASMLEKEGSVKLTDALLAFTPQTIACIVRLAFQSNGTPLIPREVLAELGYYVEAGAPPANKIATGCSLDFLKVDDVRACLGKAPARSIDHLGQLCALISQDPAWKTGGYSWGPLLFLPRFDSKAPQKSEFDGVDMGKAMVCAVATTRKMIEHVDEVFALDDDRIIEKKMEEMRARIVASNGGSYAASKSVVESAAATSTSNETTQRGGINNNNDGNGGAIIIARYRCVFPFTPETPNEIAVAEGEIIDIWDQGEDGWWTGRNMAGQEGLVPGTYLTIVDGDDDGNHAVTENSNGNEAGPVVVVGVKSF